jgi:hypothetical protein
MKGLANQANKLASAYPSNASVLWEIVRDWIDLETQSDLACFELDMLTDMVVARLKVANAAGVAA